jgi:hypothetical protein
MQKLAALAAAALAGAALVGCETYSAGPRGDGETVSIPYNPYDYDPDEINARAQAHCGAYGRRAVYEDETIDPNSVRWRYRHFRCI